MNSSNKIKILQINDNISDCSGVSKVLFNYYEQLKNEMEYDFYFIRLSNGIMQKKILENGNKIFQTSYIVNLRNIRKIRKEFKKILIDNKYDIVEMHCIHYSYIYMDICKKMNIPVRIVHAHSSMFSSSRIKSIIGRILNFRCNNNANYYFSCSDMASKYWFKNCKKVYIIPNIIDIKNSNCINESEFEKYNLKNKFVVGYVGRFSKEKNIKFIYKLIKNIKDDKFIFLLVGDGPLLEKYKKKIIKHNLNNKVIITGFKSNVTDYYRFMNLLILPSKKEGLPVSLLEAQFFDVPCLASDSITKEANLGKIKYLNLDKKIWRNYIKSFDNIGFKEINKNNYFFNKKMAALDVLNIYKKLLEEKNG